MPILPVPPSHARQQFVDAFVDGRIPAAVEQPPPRSRWRYLAWSTGSVAAAGILIACAVFLAGRSARTVPDNVVATSGGAPDKALAKRLLDIDLHLAEADAPCRASSAGEDGGKPARGEPVLAPVADAKDLNDLASLDDRVVRAGIVPGARRLPAGQRRQTLDAIAGQLARTRQATEELARRVPPDSAGALLLIAAASQSGDRDLRLLMKEATP